MEKCCACAGSSRTWASHENHCYTMEGVVGTLIEDNLLSIVKARQLHCLLRVFLPLPLEVGIRWNSAYLDDRQNADDGQAGVGDLKRVTLDRLKLDCLNIGFPPNLLAAHAHEYISSVLAMIRGSLLDREFRQLTCLISMMFRVKVATPCILGVGFALRCVWINRWQF